MTKVTTEGRLETFIYKVMNKLPLPKEDNMILTVLFQNGNWLLTASRDHLLKLFDIRNTKEEVQTFRGHKKEASTVAWHPGWISLCTLPNVTQ